ncbi:MAG: pyrroline-5-carboxylate reductase [Pseudorhodoplanes sp.]
MPASADNPGLQNVGRLALVGAGKMGGAMLQAWLRLGLDPRNVAVLEPQPSPELAALAGKGLNLNPDSRDFGAFAVVVLAVKPQAAADMLRAQRALFGPGTLVVSIMAGLTLKFLQAHCPQAAIVRAMPNTPAAIGRGVTVAVADPQVTSAQRAVAQALLAATGSAEWVSDESLMDAVTAVSGSGPAYVFLLTEALAQAGVAAGLPAPLAEKLARETVSGAGELLRQSTLAPGVLRQNVTSPGGTTAAALEKLMAPDGLAALMEKAVRAAAARSRELAG